MRQFFPPGQVKGAVVTGQFLAGADGSQGQIVRIAVRIHAHIGIVAVIHESIMIACQDVEVGEPAQVGIGG